MIHLITLKIFSKSLQEQVLEETVMMDDLATLKRIDRDFTISVPGSDVKDDVRLTLEFDPPLKLADGDSSPTSE